MQPYLLLVVLFGAAMIALLVGTWLVHQRRQRRDWARYDPPPGSGKLKPVLCPHCRQRSYSERANRERVCPNCHQSY